MTAPHEQPREQPERVVERRTGRPAQIVKVDVGRARRIIRHAQADWRIGDIVRPRPAPPADHAAS